MDPKSNSSLTRRDFIKLAGAGGAGLVLAVYLGGCAAPEEMTLTTTPPTPAETPTPTGPSAFFAPKLYLKIDNFGNLTVTAFRTEMGQGIRTAIAMILADELDMDWSSVQIEQADADSRFGDQLTGGSVSISGHYMALRQAGAIARFLLVSAAAGEWDVDPLACTTASGAVIHPNGTDRIPYGDLVKAAAALEMPKGSDIKIKEAYALKLIGSDLGHWDAPAILSGKAIYGTDVRLPGMLFAVLARCPVTGGKLSAYNADKALQVPGVKQVVEVDEKLAVVATNTWAAIKGRQALEVTWEEGKKASLDNETMLQDLTRRLPEPGSVGPGSLDALYLIPYQAHETMEPMNATADVRADRAEVWVGTQDPQQAKNAVSTRTHVPSDAVTIHLPLAGGGFGRRHIPDAAVEAALVSQAVGAPVQVMWTRDDDIQHDFYHPMIAQYASMNLSKLGKPFVRGQPDQVSLPTGYWRSVEQFPQAFAGQSFLDEVAATLGRDPLELRRELYSGPALEVINLAAEKAGWGTALPEGWGRGIGYHATFGVTHVADVAEVSVDSQGEVRVERVVCAVNCGKAVNPDNVKAQMESGMVFGLTAALMGGVTVEKGRIKQTNFHDAPILRMDQMPKIEVYIVESENIPTGIGEMGVPPIAPAVANAIFAATGKRLRRIPFRPEDILSA
jgi:isoquinoline 1-oxidoreductase beta subunit